MRASQEKPPIGGRVSRRSPTVTIARRTRRPTISAGRPGAVSTAPAAAANAAPGSASGSSPAVIVSQASICWAPSMKASSPPGETGGTTGAHATPSTVVSTGAVSESIGSMPGP